MNYLPVLLAIATAAFIGVANGKIDKEKKMAIIKACKEETHATDSDVETAKKHQIPDSQEGKCFIACGLRHYGMLKDGHLDLAGVNTFFEQALDEQEKRDKAIKVASACAATEDVKGLDECGIAAKYMHCVKTSNDFADILPELEI